MSVSFDSRLDSDYDVEFVPDQALAEDVLSDAQRFVDWAERYLRKAGKL